MNNIFDYLDWRADVPFSLDPFNEVDNVVLSELAYADFDHIVGEDPRPIDDVFTAYFSLHTREEVMARTSYTGRAPLLMEGMVGSARFGDLQVSHYMTRLNKSAQMAAVTFHLGDGTCYIAFRGTDGTLAGWKEDFNLGFQTGTEGQQLALEYLNKVGRQVSGQLRVGGHSKGGNFAVYASALCDPEVQLRIQEIYTNDGPGFREDFLESPGYQRILPRMISIIPDTSIIGMLMETGGVHHVVDSTATGIVQHDAFTWDVKRSQFVRIPMTEMGLFLNRSIKRWMAGLDDEERRTCTDAIFTILESTGAESFKEVSSQKRKSLEAMFQTFRSLPADQRQDLMRALMQLVQSSGKTAWETAFSRLLEAKQ